MSSSMGLLQFKMGVTGVLLNQTERSLSYLQIDHIFPRATLMDYRKDVINCSKLWFHCDFWIFDDIISMVCKYCASLDNGKMWSICFVGEQSKFTGESVPTASRITIFPPDSVIMMWGKFRPSCFADILHLAGLCCLKRRQLLKSKKFPNVAFHVTSLS